MPIKIGKLISTGNGHHGVSIGGGDVTFDGVVISSGNGGADVSIGKGGRNEINGQVLTEGDWNLDPATGRYVRVSDRG